MLFLYSMGLNFASLSSGSNGNCYYISGGEDAILVDAGLSYPEMMKRMKELGLSFTNIKGIFVTHEHKDHSRGLSTLANKHRIHVYVTEKTRTTGIKLIRHLAVPLVAHQTITVGAMQITALPVCHDAADPHAFLINYQGYNLGIFTDLGHACDEVTKYFSLCDAALLEFNHDEKLLADGEYSPRLKERIFSNLGHLSNRQAVSLIAESGSRLKTVFAGHLSLKNNSVTHVENALAALTQPPSLCILPAETPVMFTLVGSE